MFTQGGEDVGAIITSWPNVIIACLAAVAVGVYIIVKILQPELPEQFGAWLKRAKKRAAAKKGRDVK